MRFFSCLLSYSWQVVSLVYLVWLPFPKQFEGFSKLHKRVRARTNSINSKDLRKCEKVVKSLSLVLAQSSEMGLEVRYTVLSYYRWFFSFSLGSQNDTDIPAHLEDDETTPSSHGEDSFQNTMNMDFEVTWKAYRDGARWIRPKYSADDIAAFLNISLEK